MLVAWTLGAIIEVVFCTTYNEVVDSKNTSFKTLNRNVRDLMRKNVNDDTPEPETMTINTSSTEDTLSDNDQTSTTAHISTETSTTETISMTSSSHGPLTGPMFAPSARHDSTTETEVDTSSSYSTEETYYADNEIKGCQILGYNVYLGLNPIHSSFGLAALVILYAIWELVMFIRRCKKGKNNSKPLGERLEDLRSDTSVELEILVDEGDLNEEEEDDEYVSNVNTFVILDENNENEQYYRMRKKD